MAEDVTSVVFLEAWRRRDLVVLEQRSALPWLLGVANHTSRNATRSLRRYTHALKRLDGRRVVPSDDTVVDRIDAETSWHVVSDVVNGLSESERENRAPGLLEWSQLRSHGGGARRSGGDDSLSSISHTTKAATTTRRPPSHQGDIMNEDLLTPGVPSLSDEWIAQRTQHLIEEVTSPSPRRRRRLVIGSAGGGTVAISAVLVGLLGPWATPAFAGWSAQPTTPSSGQLTAAEASVRAHSQPTWRVNQGRRSPRRWRRWR